MKPAVEMLQVRDGLTLVQAVKASGITDASTGGAAKTYIREGMVLVNNAVETRPGRKLQPGDRFQVPGGNHWMVIA